MNFFVSFPEENDLDLWVMNESGENLAWSTSETGTYELITGLNVTAGTTYYFMVIYVDGPTDCEYSLRVKEYPANYTYYNQRPLEYTNEFYNVGIMQSLYSSTYNDDRAEAWEKESWYYNLYKYGCVASSIAMVLKNLNRQTQFAIPNALNVTNNSVPTEIMDAHPYSIMWANANSSPAKIGTANQSQITYQGTKFIISTDLNRDMAILNRENVAKLFDITMYGYRIDSWEAEDKMKIIANLLSENPEGICISFYKEVIEDGKVIGYPHTIFVASTTFEAPALEYTPSKTTTASGSTYAPGITQYSIRDIYTDLKGEISEEYFSPNTRSITNIDQGDKFMVYDTIRDGIPGFTTLTGCYTGRFYDWSHLYEIITIDINP